jgi:hypothetical protein
MNRSFTEDEMITRRDVIVRVCAIGATRWCVINWKSAPKTKQL